MNKKTKNTFLKLSITLVLCCLFISIPTQAASKKAVNWCNSSFAGERLNNTEKKRCESRFDHGYNTKSCKGDYSNDRAHPRSPNLPTVKEQCEAGKRTKVQEEERRSEGSGGSSTGGGETTATGGGETTTPTAGPDPETSEDEPAAPSRSLNQDKVSEELNAGEIKLGEEERKKTGVLNGLFGTTGEDVVGGLLNMAYTLASIIAIIVIVASGIMIVTADGDQQKVATGRQAIVYSCIGLVIVGSAFIITGIITGIGTN